MSTPEEQKNSSSSVRLLLESDPRFVELLHWIVVAALIGFGISILVALAEGHPLVALTLIIGAGFLFFSLWLLKKKQVVPAGFAIVVIFTGLLALLATIGPGMRSISNIAFPSLLIIGSLALDKSQFRILIAMTVIAMMWIIFGAQFGLYAPLPATPGTWEDFVMITAILSVTGYAARLIAEIVRSSLQRFNQELAERKTIQELLDKNQVFLKAIINNIPFDLWVCDAEGRYLIQNAISFELAGDLIGKTIDDLDFVSPKQLAIYKAEHQRVLAGETIREEIQGSIKGEERSLLSVQTPVFDEGQILGFVGMNIDLTDIRKAERSLIESEALYQSLIEVMPMSVCRKDLDGRFTFVNKHYCEGFQLPASEILGKTDYELHPRELAEKYRQDDRMVTTSGKTTEIVEEHQPLAGERSYVQVIKSPIYDAQGQVNGIQIVFWDITERVRVEEERKKLVDELQAKNEELEQFTYTVSHDLKAPLITISGFLSYLEEDALKGNVDQLKKDIQRIAGAASKMQRLLDELLELSRIGRMMNPPEDIPLEEIVREALENLEGQLSAGRIEVEVGSDLPTVHGDRMRLVAVLQNLVGNAAKFMGEQTRPNIQIGVREQNGKHLFFVKDNGIGIELEHHERIFGLFHKLDTHTTGTGIGLATVKRIVEVHGGKIWVESEGMGKGATFYFTLPVS